MSHNPYAPPSALVADVAPTSAEQPMFFAVSLTKLVVMTMGTFGLYGLYWFYCNWRTIKRRDEPKILPFWRAFFAIFYCYACFARIRDAGRQRRIEPPLSAGPLAAGWIIASAAARLPDPYWLATFASFLFLLPAQAYANRFNAVAAPAHDRNARFTAWNWVGIALGSVFFALVIVGLFYPESP